MTRYNEDGYPIQDTEYKLAKVREAVIQGQTPTDAINRNCNDRESYAAGLKEYGLKPVIPD